MPSTDQPISAAAEKVAASLPAPSNVPNEEPAALFYAGWGFAVSAKRGPGSLHYMLAAVKRMRFRIFQHAAPFCLTLAGPSGVGKTHLAEALVRSIRAHGGSCGFVRWPEWCGRGFDLDKVQELSRFRPPLVLDEAFVASGGRSDIRTATQESRALVAILEARKHAWTLLTTNASLSQIQAQDERVYSRIIRAGSFAVEVAGDTPDFSTLDQGQIAGKA